VSWWVDPAARQLRHDQRPEVINVGCDRAAAGVGEQLGTHLRARDRWFAVISHWVVSQAMMPSEIATA